MEAYVAFRLLIGVLCYPKRCLNPSTHHFMAKEDNLYEFPFKDETKTLTPDPFLIEKHFSLNFGFTTWTVVSTQVTLNCSCLIHGSVTQL